MGIGLHAPRVHGLLTGVGKVLLTAMAVLPLALALPAAAGCFQWPVAVEQSLETTALAVQVAPTAAPMLVRVRGATLPRLDGGCPREAFLAKMAKAMILVTAQGAAALLFCFPEQVDGAMEATILADGRSLAAVLAESGLAARGQAMAWCDP